MNPSAAQPAEEVRCPFCDSTDTELVAPFGSALSLSQHYCRRCRSVFERIKWDAPEPRDPASPR